MPDAGTPRLLCYHKLGSRNLHGKPLWVAVVSGSPGNGGEGIVIHGNAAATYGLGGAPLDNALTPGSRFSFSANARFEVEGAPLGQMNRNVWGLDSDQVPPEVAAAWLKYKHLGRLS